MLENMFVALAWFLTFNMWIATGILSIRTIDVVWDDDIPGKVLFVVAIIVGPVGLLMILTIWLLALLARVEWMLFRWIYNHAGCFNDLFYFIFG